MDANSKKKTHKVKSLWNKFHNQFTSYGFTLESNAGVVEPFAVCR